MVKSIKDTVRERHTYVLSFETDMQGLVNHDGRNKTYNTQSLRRLNAL